MNYTSVAAKRLPERFIHGDDPALIQRFMQEAQAQARLDHPNLCRIYEVGHVEGKPYIAMQFIEGVPLDVMRGDLSLHQKVQIIRDAAWALQAVHRLGIVHRDPSRWGSSEKPGMEFRSAVRLGCPCGIHKTPRGCRERSTCLAGTRAPRIRASSAIGSAGGARLLADWSFDGGWNEYR